jgi:hypothetical protein
MADFEEISDEMLEMVVGGARRIVNTQSASNAVSRMNPGAQYAQVNALPNGRSVEVDVDSGVFNETDGRTWYHVIWPVSGWIVGRSVGLPEE